MADVFTLCQYQHGFDEAMLRVVLATNSREAGEFVHSYLGTMLLSLAIIAIILFLAIVARRFLMRTFTISKRLGVCQEFCVNFFRNLYHTSTLIRSYDHL